MKFNPYIIQWNVNGLKTRLRTGEIQRLLENYNPVAICLQHTNGTIPSIKNYTLAASSIPNNDDLGTAIYINNKVTYDQIQINTSELQISGVKLHLNNSSFNLFNVYNQPSCNYNLQNLTNILPNINEDFLLVGDFNAHNPIWNSSITDNDTNGSKI